MRLTRIFHAFFPSLLQGKKLHAFKPKCHLLDVKNKEIFEGADSRQQWAVESADPADGLTIDDLQYILRNRKLLLAHPFSQGRITVPQKQSG